MSTQQLLVFGYCRNIESILNGAIIPNGVSNLCLIYYLSSNLMFFISYSEDMLSRNLQLFEMDSNKTFKCNHTLSGKEVSSNIHYHESVSFPPIIQRKYFDNTCGKTYDALFLSFDSEPHAFIFDPIQLQGKNADETVKIFDWTLPDINNSYSGTFEIFSNKNGLMKIGGYDLQNDKNEFHRLIFDAESNDLEILKWEQMPNMKASRYKPSAVIINGDCNEKLIVIGGYYYDMDNAKGKYPTLVEIFDFDANEWNTLKSMDCPFEEMGMFYDEEYDKRIYVAGGIDYSLAVNYNQRVVYYDINKDEWFNIGFTSNKHVCYPVLWTENRNLLYIASSRSDVECKDLRQPTDKWLRVTDHFANKSVNFVVK